MALPVWFERRVRSGGLTAKVWWLPVCWQGWVLLAGLIAVLVALISAVSFAAGEAKWVVVLASLAGFALLFVIINVFSGPAGKRRAQG